MKLLSSFLFQLLFLYSAGQQMQYPPTAIQPVADTIFGKVVVDNYRWLENVNSPQVQEWVKKQATLTNEVLDHIPGRNQLIEEYKKMDRLAAAEVSLFIVSEAGRYFYKKTKPGETYAKLYYREGKYGKESLLFDPGSDSVGFNFLPGKDGKKIAFALWANGNFDITTVKVFDVATRTFSADSLYPVGSLQAWSPDNRGFIYMALQTNDKSSDHLWRDMVVKYHIINTDMKNDRTLFSRINNPELDIKPTDFLGVNFSADNKYLVAMAWTGAQDQNKIFYSPASTLKQPVIKWKVLATPQDEVREAIISHEKAYLVSRRDAPNYKVLVTSLNAPGLSQAKTLVAESSLPVGWLQASKDYLFVQKTQGGVTEWVQHHFTTGNMQQVHFPYPGLVWIYCPDRSKNECMINLLSSKQPLARYDYNPVTQRTSVSAFNTASRYPGLADLVLKEVEVKSHDGAMVPLTLLYNRHIKKDGSNVALMSGYGSYGNVSIQSFNELFLPLLNKGVVIAITHPRGGGEKGFAWHMGGFKTTKPNTWKDFIACGEYLIREGYTSAKHLIGEGTSAGGILIGRALTERPDLFAAAINNVPVSNPVRGENRPNGSMDAKEFGTIKDSIEAMGLLEMDAYLHVKKGTHYPAVIAITGINDTRVPVWQPAKFVAALQNANADGKPVLLQVNYDSGHGAEAKNVLYRNFANMYAFALWQAGHKDFTKR